MNTTIEKALNNAAGIPSVDQISLADKIEPILQKITDPQKKDAVKEFWYTHFAEYIGVLSSIDFLIEKGEATPEEVYNEIYNINEKVLSEGDKLEEFIDNKKITSEIKNIFREICGYWVYKSKIVKHAYDKPFGYAGDYQIISMINNNKPQSQGIGYCYDKYFLNNKYSIAIRTRKNKMNEILNGFLNENHSNVEILNIGCGASLEIKELFAERTFNNSKKITFSLVDYDTNALFYSDEMLKNSPTNIICQFFNHNIIEYIRNPAYYFKLLAGKDLIYSIGLFDYLPIKILKKLIVFFFTILNPGGRLIIAHKDSITYKPLASDWWCNWKFYHRDRNKLIDLVNNSGIEDFSLKITEDSISKIIFFLIIEKNR